MQVQLQQQRQEHVPHNWVRRFEHTVLRVVSLFFSLASAHAIRWFFAPLDRVDVLQPAITWIVAIGFGLLGYFVSRGLAHRLMNHERVRSYVPIVIVVELVEVVCNYALAAGVIQQATWLETIPAGQRALLTDATYLVLSIIPLVSVLLAVVDMDLERKQGSASVVSPVARASANNGQPASRVPMTPRPAQQGANGANTTRQGQGGFKFPFSRRDEEARVTAQPKDSPSSVRSPAYDPEKDWMSVP